MITIISSTNRPDSNTFAIANFCRQYLENEGETVELLRLDSISSEILSNAGYLANEQDPHLRALQEKYILPAEKFIFVIPEYNGGVPGILKLFIDELSVWKFEESFKDKKACLIGISSGRAGNLRGLDYFTNVLNYIKTHVFRVKLPISSIETFVDKDGVINEACSLDIQNLLKAFQKF